MKYTFPKVDLHLHLDGSFRPETVWELAGGQGVRMPAETLQGYKDWMIKCSDSQSVNEYLKMFDPPIQVMQEEAALSRITYELIEDLAEQGLCYAEIRFAPQLHTRKGLSQKQAIEAVLAGRNKALEDYPQIRIGIILCLMCVGDENANYDANMETATIAHEYLDKGVVCIDLAGAEGIVPLSHFAPFFEAARKLNTPAICHAGDSQDWQTVQDAVEMGAVRIGHGHHVYENPQLSRYLADHDIALEICPTSNVQCKTRSSYSLHPAYNLYCLGVPVTINTDNMTMANVTLDDEYDHCLEQMGFEFEDLILMNIASLRHSFLKETEKEELISRLEKCLDEAVNR